MKHRQGRVSNLTQPYYPLAEATFCSLIISPAPGKASLYSGRLVINGWGGRRVRYFSHPHNRMKKNHKGKKIEDAMPPGLVELSGFGTRETEPFLFCVHNRDYCTPLRVLSQRRVKKLTIIGNDVACLFVIWHPSKLPPPSLLCNTRPTTVVGHDCIMKPVNPRDILARAKTCSAQSDRAIASEKGR